MDNVDFFKEVLLALKFELIRYRVGVVVLAVFLLFGVLMLGLGWQSLFVSRATVAAEVNKSFELVFVRGRQDNKKIDHIAEASDQINSRVLLEEAARELGYIDENSSAEKIGETVSYIAQGISIEKHQSRKNYINISFSSEDSETSFETLTVLVKLLVEHHRLAAKAEEQNEYEFYAKQVKIYEERLIESEAAIKEFKVRSKELDEEDAQKRISLLTSEIQDLDLGVQETETTIIATRKQLGNESAYLGVQARVFNLKRQKAALQTQLSSLRMQFQESYPDIVSIREQLADIEKQTLEITKEFGAHISTISIGDGLETNPEVLYDELRKELAVSERLLQTKRKRLTSLKTLLEEQYERISIVATSQVELADLLRDYNVTKETHAELLTRKENAEISLAGTNVGQGLTYRIVKEASFPLSPSGLTFKHFLLVAPVLAIGAPIGLLLATIILDPRLRTPSNLGQGLLQDYRLLVVIPHYHTAFSQRLVKKDMILLSGVLALGALLYVFIAIIGLSG